MAILFPGIIQATSRSSNIPKGYCVVYVGDNQKKRFVIPVSFLNQPSFQELLSKAKEEFGYNHPTGVLTILCSEDHFYNIMDCLQQKQ